MPDTAAPTEWFPARLFPPSPGTAPPEDKDKVALIILNQPLNDQETLERLWHRSSYHVAADGGANELYNAGQRVLHSQGAGDQHTREAFNDLHVIIGDLDSLTPTTRAYYEQVTGHRIAIIHEADQYSTDFTKAVRHIRKAKGPVDIVCMGGLGGRVDQGLSQLHHLYLFQTSPAYAEGRVYLVSGESLTFLLKAGAHRIHVRPDPAGRSKEADTTTTKTTTTSPEEEQEQVFGKHVGIIPIKEPSVISTRGLEWDVEDWPTEFGGQLSTSNHVLPDTEVVEIQTAKDVLFTIALKGWGGI